MMWYDVNLTSLLGELKTNMQGLTDEEAQKRLLRDGPNELAPALSLS